jgi:hypothetical protein
MSEFKVALFGSGGTNLSLAEVDDRGGKVFVDRTVCLAHVDGAI